MSADLLSVQGIALLKGASTGSQTLEARNRHVLAFTLRDHVYWLGSPALSL